MVMVTAAVLSLPFLVKSVHPVVRQQTTALPQIFDDLVSFAVDVRRDVMRDLAGGMAEADLGVESRRPEPQGPTVFVYFFSTPEADMMAPARVVPEIFPLLKVN